MEHMLLKKEEPLNIPTEISVAYLPFARKLLGAMLEQKSIFMQVFTYFLGIQYVLNTTQLKYRFYQC